MVLVDIARFAAVVNAYLRGEIESQALLAVRAAATNDDIWVTSIGPARFSPVERQRLLWFLVRIRTWTND